MASQSQCGFRCRPRFKGIETFLRRVAFNLGNSPSQTEVKIISCIPIDVTDLQHRIVTLERELEQYQHQPPESPAAVCTALGVSTPHRGEPPGPLPEHLTPNSTTTSHDKSNPSLPYHASEHQELFPRPMSATRTREVPVIENYGSRTRNDESFYRNKIKLSKKRKTSKPRTELIYFAQQDVKTPFDQMQSTSKDTPIENMLGQEYLADIARKQGRSERIPSNQSEFSSPICRDNGSATLHRPPIVCESDVCSCCRGHYHDVDASRRAYSRYDMPSAPNDLSMYYDSSMYDLVPVKEKKDDITPKKKEEQLKCNHGKIYRSRMQPYTVTYSNGALRNGRRLVGKRKVHVKSPNRVPKRRYEQFAVDKGFSTKRSEKLYQDMELQTYYMRPMRKVRHPSPPKAAHVEQKNAECLTMNLNTTECQTASTKSVQLDTPPPPIQTNNEATLNQIKTILQTVLTEVKTNVREKIQETHNVQETQRVQENQKVQENIKIEAKKDAVVQKDASQRNIDACSTLLNSFYYSPYSMNPMNPYSAASCPPPQYYPNGYYPPTMKCFQNYPLFIQTTGRPCDLCSKIKPPTTKKASHGKHAANTATNTDSVIKSQHSKETEKLIKEIYKSIAVNFDMTSKEATTSEGDDLKSEPSKHNFNRKTNESKQRESMPVKSPRTRDTAATPLYMNPTFNSARTSDEVSVHSTRVATRNEGILRTVNLLTQPQDSASEKSEEKRKWNRKKVRVPVETDSDKTDSVDIDATASEVTVIPVKKKERSSLFTKVRNVFKSKTKKNNEVQHSVTESEHEDVEEYEESDSDYQTVYSERDDTRGPRTVTAAPVHLPAIREHRYRRLSHSKVAFPRYVPQTRAPERPRRPYMEQEYRRQWNEGISFRCPPSRSARHAHEARSSKPEHQYADSTPTYWRNYETRHAYVERDVEPDEESPQTEDQNDYEMQARRHHQVTYNEEDKPKVFKSVAKKFQWFTKNKLPECRHTWKKLLVDS